MLKPGGIFVGSTFLNSSAPLGQILGNDELVAPLKRLEDTYSPFRQQYKFWGERELRDLFASVGLQNFKRHRRVRFILWSVQKPGRAEDDETEDEEGAEGADEEQSENDGHKEIKVGDQY